MDTKGTYSCCREIIPIMIKQKSGVIVNVSSTPAVVGYYKGAPYKVAKAGLHASDRGVNDPGAYPVSSDESHVVLLCLIIIMAGVQFIIGFDLVRKAFEFVKISDVPQKPRDSGIIEIRGPYYTPTPLGYVKDLLDTWGEYVDGLKFAGGSMRLLPSASVRKIIKTCHDHNVYVSTGGFVERVIAQGQEAVDEYLEECKALEFDVVEVSSGLAPIPLQDKVNIVKQVKEMGMKPKPEISLMMGAGAGTHIVGYETRMRSIEDFVEEVKAHLKAGAHIMMLESEGVTEDLPPEKWRLDLIERVTKEFGFKVWMFESSDPPVFKWYLKQFGPHVNLFIDHSQIVEFTAWKTKLWGDPDIWKGKKLSYKPKR